jgi:hypothetical protein
MTYRIDRLVTAENLVLFRMSGQIDEEGLDTMGQVLAGEKGEFAIDLKEVSLICREAVVLLALIETRGIELRNCPSYIRDWVDREKRRGVIEGP